MSTFTSKCVNLGNNYVYCTQRQNKSFIYDIYGFSLNNKRKQNNYLIKFKHSINLQLNNKKDKKIKVKLLQLQHNCVIFSIIIKKTTFIYLFRFQHESCSKYVFKTKLDANKIMECSFAFGDILLFCVKNTSSSCYYAIYSIQNNNISCQYIHCKENNKALIVIPPSMIHPKYQIASCLKCVKCIKDNINNNDIIWNLSLFISNLYLRKLKCITPHFDESMSKSTYNNWSWWISIQKNNSSNQCRILLIKQQQIIASIPLKEDGILKPLSLISIPNFDCVLFMTQKQNKCLQSFIIKRDSYYNNKLNKQKQYNQLIINNHENDSNISNIYKIIHRYKFENDSIFCNFDTKYLLLLSYKMEQDTFKIKTNNSNSKMFIKWKFQYWNIQKLISYKIPRFFQITLNSLNSVIAKRLQNCFKLKYLMLQLIYTQCYDNNYKYNDKNIVNFEWKNDIVIKLPFSSLKNKQNLSKSMSIILSCPYMRFTAFSTNFHIDSPTKYIESIKIGNFISLKQNINNQSIMIHLFENDRINLHHLIAYKLSMNELIGMQCSSQKLHFYDGFQQKEINKYLINSYNSDKNEIKYDEIFKYLNKFLISFEKEIEENVSKNINFYQSLKSRLLFLGSNCLLYI